MKKPTVVVTAGMQGSGSTWLYNAVRFAYLNDGYTVYGVFATAYQPETDAEVHVVKAHDYDEALADKADLILVTRRPVLDAAASVVAKGLVADEPAALVEFMRDLIDNERQWLARAHLVFEYEGFHADDREALKELQIQLGVYCGATSVTETHQDLDNLKRTVNNHVDHVTHFWPNHIRDGGIGTYTKRLSPESIRALETALYECDHANA